jgi:predicted phosphodiesterase
MSEVIRTSISDDRVPNPVRILHITDSHISVDVDEGDYADNASRMYNAFKDRDTVASFERQLAVAVDENVDLIALGGDQVNYPSAQMVDVIIDRLEATGKPWIYTAGNHDWHYEGLPTHGPVLREQWRGPLLPLYAGRGPHASSIEIKGLRIIAIDNSTFQVDEDQLAFFVDQTSDDTPVLLLVHIPLSVGDLRQREKPVCGDPRWGWDTDTNFETERRDRWPETGNLVSTEAFVQCVSETPNLAAVLCGHIHEERIDAISDRSSQYVTAPGFQGVCRLVTIGLC